VKANRITVDVKSETHEKVVGLIVWEGAFGKLGWEFCS